MLLLEQYLICMINCLLFVIAISPSAQNVFLIQGRMELLWWTREFICSGREYKSSN